MKKNVSNTDRIVRLITGIVCTYLVAFNPLDFTNLILLVAIGLFAAINLFTAIFSYCPLYQIAGLSTRKD